MASGYLGLDRRALMCLRDLGSDEGLECAFTASGQMEGFSYTFVALGQIEGLSYALTTSGRTKGIHVPSRPWVRRRA
ncbi:hypothetical protein TorRG33x02_355190 [Trema orientale]|uniref:Uncharacterized protein n=1 Tax=Trema orientale TaxID=63057 RepID=A0A2P5A9N7_TREOI|nr:hypothetical protein TorRG33x02_355190 [Trema orientale]